MPTNATGGTGGAQVASRRIVRLAFGTCLCCAFSQVVAWPLSFMAPILAMTALATPMRPPGPSDGIKLAAAAILPVLAGSIVLLPFFEHLHSVGILLLALALFHTFYSTARGLPELIGTLLAMGITLNVTIGSISVDALYGTVTGIAVSVGCALVFVWIAFAFLPDVPAKNVAAASPRPSTQPESQTPGIRALRATAIVLPLAVYLLLSPASSSYTILMIKVASMGQQATAEDSHSMGRSLIASTFWGGIGAILGWSVLRLWPSLFFLTLLVALAMLLYGRRVFRGHGLHEQGAMWSYAALTFLLLLLPAALDTVSGSSASSAFWTRLVLVGIASVYGSLAMTVFSVFASRSGVGVSKAPPQPRSDGWAGSRGG